MVSLVEKYACEIEIFNFGRCFRARISHGSVQRMRLSQSMIRSFGRTDFLKERSIAAAHGLKGDRFEK